MWNLPAESEDTVNRDNATQRQNEEIIAEVPGDWAIVLYQGAFFAQKTAFVGDVGEIVGIGAVEWCDQWLTRNHQREVDDFDSMYRAYCD
jgi:hypothetical protein